MTNSILKEHERSVMTANIILGAAAIVVEREREVVAAREEREVVAAMEEREVVAAREVVAVVVKEGRECVEFNE
jgi:hypothetical protein